MRARVNQKAIRPCKCRIERVAQALVRMEELFLLEAEMGRHGFLTPSTAGKLVTHCSTSVTFGRCSVRTPKRCLLGATVPHGWGTRPLADLRACRLIFHVLARMAH